VEITNLTGEDVYLVGSLDASDCKWRYPYCYFEVIGPDGKSTVQGIGRCGNMNPLREEDFIKVQRGGKFDPYQQGYGSFSAYQLSPRSFPVAGKYRIRFVYSTESGQIMDWLGDDVAVGEQRATKRFGGLFKQVPKAKVTSNEINVSVVK
jgi:hypothetical protein